MRVKEIIFLVVAITVAGCNESRTPDPETLGYDFYPIQVGQFRIYDVEEVTYRVLSFDTAVYQLRETIFDSIVSLDQVSYLIRRDVRSDAQQEWQSDSIWSVTRKSSYLSITENGIPFIKLTFPVGNGNQWDGNSLNSNGELIYYYESLPTAVIDTIAQEDHVRVILEDIEENITGIDLRSEVYVRGIGLVEKDYLTQIKCTSSSCGEDLGKVVAGRSLKQILIEVGNE